MYENSAIDSKTGSVAFASCKGDNGKCHLTKYSFESYGDQERYWKNL